MYTQGTDSFATRSWAQTLRFVSVSALSGIVLLDLAYYFHSVRLYRPMSRDAVMALNAFGAMALLTAGAALMMTAAVKAGRRLPARFHRTADVVLAVLGFVLASASGLYAMQRIYGAYERLETEALTSRGVTVTARIEGRRFRRLKQPHFNLFFRVRNASGGMQTLSIDYPIAAGGALPQSVTIRYLPANPEIFRQVDAASPGHPDRR